LVTGKAHNPSVIQHPSYCPFRQYELSIAQLHASLVIIMQILSSGAAYAGATTYPGESFKLSGSKMVMNIIKMKVSIPFTADHKVNPIPALTMILKASKYLDVHSLIKSNNPMFADIKNVNDVTNITDIDKFV
jgi:hypothetical protein